MTRFLLESQRNFRLPSAETTIKVFKHAESNFRCVFVPLPGPLCSATLLVPTLAVNHKGLAHTLEHLIFCGSRSFPFRGYLDYLATRALSTGTNGYLESIDCSPVDTQHTRRKTIRGIQSRQLAAKGCSTLFPPFWITFFIPRCETRSL